MQFFTRDFDTPSFTIYPLGDFHYGSRQCDEAFIAQVIDEVRGNPLAYWVGMGDMMENALIGSKSDVYTQTVQPKEQIEHLVDMLKPIKDKGLFMIAGNHEQRTTRMVGLVPEQHIALMLGIPYAGFSCLAYFQSASSKSPHGFTAYFHHNTGGGYTAGGKVNAAARLRQIVPTADATFTAHVHTTSRMPVTWFECSYKSLLKRTGYDYTIGSALTWNESYAEEKAKRPASLEFIKVTFHGATRGDCDNRRQVYEVISKGASA